MGNRLIHSGFEFPGLALQDQRAVPAILSTIGLAHDIGNPPFGHQGEAAISHWFTKNDVFVDPNSPENSVPQHLHEEFLSFEGNAQAFRILTRLQVALGGFGLDLTAATLAALMKYPVTVDLRSKSSVSTKKYGYFESEHKIVHWVRNETGLVSGQRHPLTWIMEAADDIAYSTLDIEDAIHKGIISPDDVRSIVSHDLKKTYPNLISFLEKKFSETRRKKGLSIKEVREIMSSYLRTGFIETLIGEVIDDFTESKYSIFDYSRTKPLGHKSKLLSLLKDIAHKHVFVDSDVRKIEADGYRIIGGLMSFYWHAITNRQEWSDLNSRRLDARAAYGISKISDNYLQNAARNSYYGRNNRSLPMRYKELRLLTDMVSGMSDGFAKSEYEMLVDSGLI